MKEERDTLRRNDENKPKLLRWREGENQRQNNGVVRWVKKKEDWNAWERETKIERWRIESEDKTERSAGKK